MHGNTKPIGDLSQYVHISIRDLFKILFLYKNVCFDIESAIFAEILSLDEQIVFDSVR